MAIFLECPNCRTKLKVGDEARGKLVRCSKCQVTTLIPNDAPVAGSAANEAPAPIDLLAPDANLAVREHAPLLRPLDHDEPPPRRRANRDAYWDEHEPDESPIAKPRRRRRLWPWILGG